MWEKVDATPPSPALSLALSHKGRGVAHSKRFRNLPQHSVKIAVNIAIPKTDFAYSGAAQEFCSFGIVDSRFLARVG